ncbi:MULTISPECIES: hypothetical protein [Prochlorococcus]|uniref:hypothetical protein n=1 Tax=Prochlorococcus TaxID=1218 RepID=UPI0005338C5A|nr:MULTISPECIES: hypothetical protein [Prochlorococcus]KGG12270.1 hypothetical protein EV05_1480 [Prochlorococcus sp. MIT 0601]
MSCRHPLAACAIFAGLLFSDISAFAETSSPENYKVLSTERSGLNLDTVQTFLDKGDDLFLKGDLDKARVEFDKARDVSKQLLSFYRDIGSAFKGMDARIPREMDSNGRKVLGMLAKSNLRLANLFRKKNQPEVAVPLLVEVVRVMTPAKAEGQQAYQALVELGFVNIPYAGGRKNVY